MSRFIAVIHSWHVNSLGFQIVSLNQRSQAEAEAKAAVLAMNSIGCCRSADYAVVEIADRECLLPRRLTWKERLTGALGPITHQEQPQ